MKHLFFASRKRVFFFFQLALALFLSGVVAFEAPVKVRPPKKGAVASWHAERRAKITELVGKAQVEAWTRPMPLKTLSALVTIDVAQTALAVSADEWWQWVPCALTVGAWLSLGQFALLHDVLHGSADPEAFSSESSPALARREFRRRALFCLSAPSAFGYWLYLELGHLSHHAFTGDASVDEVFDSDQLAFEDGDLFFAAHRQRVEKMPTSDTKGGPPVSVARTFFGLWRKDRRRWNQGLYCLSMLSERAALFLNDKYVALSGSNAFFFPNKPREFHDTCAAYARYAFAVQSAIVAANSYLVHDGTFSLAAIAYLVLAETAWQLPFFPASALFLSNHFAEDDDDDDDDDLVVQQQKGRPLPPIVGSDPTSWPSHSVYDDALYDLLCFNANFHVEHHDFPEVPLWRLPELRAAVHRELSHRTGDTPPFYPPSPPPTEVIERAFQQPTVYAAWSRDRPSEPASQRVSE